MEEAITSLKQTLKEITNLISAINSLLGAGTIKFKNKIIKFSIINNSIFEEESLYGENLFIVMSNYDNYINTSDYLSYLNLINSDKNKNYHELDEVSRFVEKIGDNFKEKLS